MKIRAIGILDSGIGGLTVAREVVRLLPHEDIMYAGDRKNAPYGARSKNEILDLSRKMVEFLLKKNVKAVVAACNTITVNCLGDLRNEYPEIPIIGTVPVIKTAVERTRSQRIGILSTTATATSAYQENLITKFAGDCSVVNAGSDELVPYIEAGKIDGKELEVILDRVLKIFKENRIDMLALGCTHFPYIREQIAKILGKDVEVLDSGAAIARQVKRVLEVNMALNTKNTAKYELHFTGGNSLPIKVINNLWGGDISGDIIFADKF